MIDETDIQILEILQQNARTANAEIARQVGMAPSAILERIRKLEERGVIEGYSARINAEAYGLSLTAFVFVRADERLGAPLTAERLAEIPEVQEVHHVAGEDCFLIKVRVAGTRAMRQLLQDKLAAIDTIRSTRSTIVLDTVKETAVLPRPPGETTMPEARKAPPGTAMVLAAFAAVYVVWGSTYLAIRVAIETLPPLLMAGARFLLAGGILYAFMRLRGEPAPARRHWVSTSIVGMLLLMFGNGGVVLAERSVPSGVVALLVAMVPMWMVLLEWLRPGGTRPTLQTVIGLGIGFTGIVLLIGPAGFAGGDRVDPLGALLVTAGAAAWAAGSIYSRGAPLPRSAMVATGMEMGWGGFWLLLAGTVRGEWATVDPSAFTTASVLAFLYLVAFGSLVGFTAYIWLLGVSTPARVSTYAYVNPVVAVLLGWAFLDEPLTPRVLGAAAVIILAVAVITTGKRAAPAEPRTDAEGSATAGGERSAEARRSAA